MEVGGGGRWRQVLYTTLGVVCTFLFERSSHRRHARRLTVSSGFGGGLLNSLKVDGDDGGDGSASGTGGGGRLCTRAHANAHCR